MPTRSLRGITLVEVLVCMGVIGVLLFLSIGVLRSSRSVGFRVSCLANLQTIGRGISMYAHDHQELLPWTEFPIDVRRGSRQPLVVLSEYLDVNPPSMDANGKVISPEPWRCNADHDIWPKVGSSYIYTPHELFAASTSPNPHRAVTQYITQDPNTVIFADLWPWHRLNDQVEGLIGRNVLLLGGAARIGDNSLSPVPRGPIPLPIQF